MSGGIRTKPTKAQLAQREMLSKTKAVTPQPLHWDEGFASSVTVPPHVDVEELTGRPRRANVVYATPVQDDTKEPVVMTKKTEAKVPAKKRAKPAAKKPGNQPGKAVAEPDASSVQDASGDILPDTSGGISLDISGGIPPATSSNIAPNGSAPSIDVNCSITVDSSNAGTDPNVNATISRNNMDSLKDVDTPDAKTTAGSITFTSVNDRSMGIMSTNNSTEAISSTSVMDSQVPPGKDNISSTAPPSPSAGTSGTASSQVLVVRANRLDPNTTSTSPVVGAVANQQDDSAANPISTVTTWKRKPVVHIEYDPKEGGLIGLEEMVEDEAGDMLIPPKSEQYVHWQSLLEKELSLEETLEALAETNVDWSSPPEEWNVRSGPASNEAKAEIEQIGNWTTTMVKRQAEKHGLPLRSAWLLSGLVQHETREPNPWNVFLRRRALDLNEEEKKREAEEKEAETERRKNENIIGSIKGKADNEDDDDKATPDLVRKTIPQIIQAEWNALALAERKAVSSRMLEEQLQEESTRAATLLTSPKERVKFVTEEVDSLTRQAKQLSAQTGLLSLGLVFLPGIPTDAPLSSFYSSGGLAMDTVKHFKDQFAAVTDYLSLMSLIPNVAEITQWPLYKPVIPSYSRKEVGGPLAAYLGVVHKLSAPWPWKAGNTNFPWANTNIQCTKHCAVLGGWKPANHFPGVYKKGHRLMALKDVGLDEAQALIHKFNDDRLDGQVSTQNNRLKLKYYSTADLSVTKEGYLFETATGTTAELDGSHSLTDYPRISQPVIANHRGQVLLTVEEHESAGQRKTRLTNEGRVETFTKVDEKEDGSEDSEDSKDSKEKEEASGATKGDGTYAPKKMTKKTTKKTQPPPLQVVIKRGPIAPLEEVDEEVEKEKVEEDEDEEKKDNKSKTKAENKTKAKKDQVKKKTKAKKPVDGAKPKKGVKRPRGGVPGSGSGSDAGDEDEEDEEAPPKKRSKKSSSHD